MRLELLIEKRTKPSATELKYGYFIEHWFNKNKKLQGANSNPATIFYRNGEVVGRFWYKNGIEHRDKGQPAEAYYKEGKITSEVWFRNGKYIKTEFYSIY